MKKLTVWRHMILTPLSQTVTLSQTPPPRSVTYFMDGPLPLRRTHFITGAVHEVCHAPREGRGSVKVWQFVTGGGGKDHVTSYFQCFHNLQFHVFLSFIIQILVVNIAFGVMRIEIVLQCIQLGIVAIFNLKFFLIVSISSIFRFFTFHVIN